MKNMAIINSKLLQTYLHVSLLKRPLSKKIKFTNTKKPHRPSLPKGPLPIPIVIKICNGMWCKGKLAQLLSLPSLVKLTLISKDAGDLSILNLARDPNTSGADQCAGWREILSRTSTLCEWNISRWGDDAFRRDYSGNHYPKNTREEKKRSVR